MNSATLSLLILIVLFELKHTLADFCMQSEFMLTEHWRYLHAGRAVHCLIHATLTAAVLLIVGTGAGLLVAIVALEWVMHFHIDWLKANHQRATRYNVQQRAYWVAFGIDQLSHQLTYLGIAWWWVSAQF